MQVQESVKQQEEKEMEPAKYVYYKRHDYEEAQHVAEQKMVKVQAVKCVPQGLGAPILWGRLACAPRTRVHILGSGRKRW